MNFLNLIKDNLEPLLPRLADYYHNNPAEMLVELLVIFIIVYAVVRYLRGTRGARAIKGMALILIVITALVKMLTADESFRRLNFLYSNFLTIAGLSMIVVFQPELRRAMVRLGEARLFRAGRRRRAHVVEAIVKSVTHMSKKRIGVLIALEREVGLTGTVDAGVELDAVVTEALLNTIFYPGSALHDLGVIIADDRIVAAGAQFPLAEGDQFDTELGSRHRAAVGLSLEGDPLVVVVSEETGTISLAERGKLYRNLTPDELRTRLLDGLAGRWLFFRFGRSASATRVEPTPMPKPSEAVANPSTSPGVTQKLPRTS